MESKQEFAHWIKKKMVKKPFFRENTDWALFDNVIKNPIGGRPTKDYVLTIDTAKKVSMSKQTQKGDEIRDYFLQCEKSLQEVRSVLPSNYISALKQLIIEEEAKEALLIENNEMKPKA